MMRKQIQQYKTLNQKQWGSSKRLTDGLRNISVQIKCTTLECFFFQPICMTAVTHLLY